jgi:kynurenine/2-aminoadipate aminotransferase
MKIMDYSRYLTRIALLRRPSPIRAIIPLLREPGMISLGAGTPNASLFPFESIEFKVKNSDLRFSLDSEELDVALQYSPTAGVPQLLEFLKKLNVGEHNRDDSEILVTGGSQDALTRAFEMLLNPGDSLVIEDPTYSGALSFLFPLNLNMIAVKTDKFGMIPEELDKALAEKRENAPKVIYLIPTAQNPSGATMVDERKRKIYEIARKYDLIILEDDPYYFLSPERGKSFLSMDEDGRVLRFDSFSKVLSSGMRIGWVSGPAGLVGNMNLHVQATTLHTSGISQMLAAKLLNHWGVEGFQNHVNRVVSPFYQQRKESMLKYAKKHLAGLATWDDPESGMFLWIKLNNVNDSRELIEKRARDAKVVLIPGDHFSPTKHKSSYVRASFSQATDQQMDTAFSRLSDLLKSLK